MNSPTELYRAYTADPIAAVKWGPFDSQGRPALIKADDGNAVSARVYDRYSGVLVMECKRVNDLECEKLVPASGTPGTPDPAPANDLYRADSTRASYIGTLLAGYTENGTSTSYAFTYTSSGKIGTATASRSGTLPGSQNYEETFGYDGLGNVKTATVKQGGTGTSFTSDLKQTYTPKSGGGTTILDQARSIGTTKTTGSFPAASEVEYTYDAMNRLRAIKRGTAAPRKQ